MGWLHALRPCGAQPREQREVADRPVAVVRHRQVERDLAGARRRASRAESSAAAAPRAKGRPSQPASRSRSCAAGPASSAATTTIRSASPAATSSAARASASMPPSSPAPTEKLGPVSLNGDGALAGERVGRGRREDARLDRGRPARAEPRVEAVVGVEGRQRVPRDDPRAGERVAARLPPRARRPRRGRGGRARRGGRGGRGRCRSRRRGPARSAASTRAQARRYTGRRGRAARPLGAPGGTRTSAALEPPNAAESLSAAPSARGSATVEEERRRVGVERRAALPACGGGGDALRQRVRRGERLEHAGGAEGVPDLRLERVQSRAAPRPRAPRRWRAPPWRR